MSSPRRFIDYPIEYTELLRRAMKVPIRIPFSTSIEAVRLRNHLYAFRKAIRDDNAAPDDLVLTAPLISFQIDSNTLIVHKPKRTSNMRKALEGVET